MSIKVEKTQINRQIFTVRQARKMADKTQQYMADALDVDRSTYIKWERDPSCINVPNARAISEITGIPFDQIFFGVNSTISRPEA